MKTALIDKYARNGAPEELSSGNWEAVFEWLGPKLALLMFVEKHKKDPQARPSMFSGLPFGFKSKRQ